MFRPFSRNWEMRWEETLVEVVLLTRERFSVGVMRPAVRPYRIMRWVTSFPDWLECWKRPE